MVKHKLLILFLGIMLLLSDNVFVFAEKLNVLIGGAWPYPTSSLHLGNLTAMLPGDFLARYHRLKGDNVIYISGTDCHGAPVIRTGNPPNEVSEHYHEEFKKTFQDMSFSYDLYTKTSDEYHKTMVKKLFKIMLDKGYIKEIKAPQTYCTHCKKLVFDREIEGECIFCGNKTKEEECDNCGHVPTEIKNAVCRTCNNKTILVNDKNLYLMLSKLQPKLEDYVNQNKENWRISCITEVERCLKEGLKDRPITRDLTWGIDVPCEGYENKSIFVWIDALLGYVTATQKFCEEHDLNWEDFWKENGKNKIYMVFGKDNVTFHALVFPALLASLEENYHLPDTMVNSQYLMINSEKFSKTRNNSITVNDMIKKYNTDSLRYYLLSNGPENEGSNFSLEHFKDTHNNQLFNKYEGFLDKILRFEGLNKIPNGKMDEEIKIIIDKTYTDITEDIKNLNFKKAISKIMTLLDIGNKYYYDKKPWIQKDTNVNEFNNTMYTCINIIANLANLFEPVMPKSSNIIKEYLGIEEAKWEQIFVKSGRNLENMNPLFERID